MRYKPMLLIRKELENFKNNNYIYEPKLDGYRALCYKDQDGLKFISRNGKDLTKLYPELDFLENIKSKNAVIDGEIVVYNNKGLPDFNLLQNRNTLNITRFPATFVAFDILMKDGIDLTSRTLIERKLILEKTIKESENLQKIFFTENKKMLISEMQKRNMEGIVAKLKNSSYQQKRSRDWIKIKFYNTADCIIIGYTSKKRQISSLALGVYDKNKIKYIGKVGTGFNEQLLNKLKKILIPIKTDFIYSNEKDARNITWVLPEFVCEVKFLEYTKTKRLRAPVFLRIREDIFPEECKLNQLKF